LLAAVLFLLPGCNRQKEDKMTAELFNGLTLAARLSLLPMIRFPVPNAPYSLQEAVASLESGGDSSTLSRWIQALPDFVFSGDPAFKTAQALFSEILADGGMASHKCLHLLIVHWAVYQIRVWTQRLK
jgi:hypothetical protein